MNDIRVRGHYEHPMSRWYIAISIDDPWCPKSYFLYRMPEALTVNGRPYIWQPAGGGSFPAIQPEAAPEWTIDDQEKRTEYNIRFYDGIEFSAEAKVIDKGVEFRYVIHNGTEQAAIFETGSCFMLWTSPHFIDRRHDRTFVWLNGSPVSVRTLTPTPEDQGKWSWIQIGVGMPAPKRAEGDKKYNWPVNETADHGLICVKNVRNDCCLGLAWGGAKGVMARTTIPCLHSKPGYPSVEPGHKVEATGRLYFDDGDISRIAKRYLDDIKEKKLYVSTLDSAEKPPEHAEA